MREGRNRFLHGLPPADLACLKQCGERVWLSADTPLADIGMPLSHACFPMGATIAVMAHVGHAAGLQVALIGADGLFASLTGTGVPTAPLAARICTAGWVWRLDSRCFQQWLASSAELRWRLGRYLLVLMAQVAELSVCTRYQQIEQRLARWILIVADQVQGRNFRLRHLTMAEMLGTHRSAISLAAMRLKNDGLIDYRRGLVTVLNRDGLDAMACRRRGQRRVLPAHAIAADGRD